MRMAGWINRYIAHPDPSTRVPNLIAVVVGGNGPFYPLFVAPLTRWGRPGIWLTMLSTPLFLAIPLLSRRDPVWSRLSLPLVGAVNTVRCSLLPGASCRVDLFLLPCLALCALRLPRVPAVMLRAAIVLAEIVLTEYEPAGLVGLTLAEGEAVARLNAVSVARLSAVIALNIGAVLRGNSSGN